MVDGIDSVDIEAGDPGRLTDPRSAFPDELWMPEMPPSSTGLLLGAVGDIFRRPAMMADNVFGWGSATSGKASRWFTSAVGGMASAVRSVVKTRPGDAAQHRSG